jgi:hypothetical protein
MVATSSRSLDDLLLAEVREYGVLFSTGVPVEFKYIRNTEKSPYLGSRFQQDIEPAGAYLLHNPDPGDPARGWVQGVAKFRSPLVLALAGDDDGKIYGPNSWKARLHRHFKKRHAALSKAIMAAGFDAVVTVGYYRGRPQDTREIVDLSVVR